MAVFSDSDILTILRDQNPWWSSGAVPSPMEKPYHRGEYYETSRVFTHPIRRFPVLSGLRRVGKSCILYQMIGDLLRSGINPVKILYVSLDTAVLSEAGLLRSLHLYRSVINNDPEFYFFADEIQKDSDWASVMKHVYDTFPAARAVATGSASGKIEKKHRETGEGRLHLIKVPTLSFYDYCAMKEIDIPTPDTDDLFSLHTLPQSVQASIMMKLSGLSSVMYSYFHLGGFPEFVNVSPADESYVLSLIAENVINKAIYTDLADERVNPSQLRKLFIYLCNTTSNQLNIEEMCSQLGGLSPITAGKYLEILENANLIYRSWPILQGGKKALKAQAKIYIADTGIREAVMSGLYPQDDPVQLGYIVESSAYKHTVDYCRVRDLSWSVGYLRPQASRNREGEETDIVLYNGHGILQLVESKYRNNPIVKDTDMILKAALKDKPGYVITKAPDDFGLISRDQSMLYRIPAQVYLYLMGLMQHNANLKETRKQSSEHAGSPTESLLI
ncbi:MAG: ATP-binding protein [Clostridia bacterium]|nr:ATP-binding protein [Clostridia bacterium]